MPQQQFDQAKALDEIKSLEQNIEQLTAKLNELKTKIQTEGTSQKEHLDIIVTNIEQIDRIVRDRRDVGH